VRPRRGVEPREYYGSAFGVTETVGEELPPSYNVAPQAFVYSIVDTATSRRLGVMQWGLVPSWAVDPDAGRQPPDVRASRPHAGDPRARRGRRLARPEPAL